jgi:hypothetical protein
MMTAPFGRPIYLARAIMLLLPDGEDISLSVPESGQTVQGWSADEVNDQDDDVYQSFECLACTTVHLINPKTGKVLGERED